MNSDGFVTQLEGDLPKLLVISRQSNLAWLLPVVEGAMSFGLQGELVALENDPGQALQEAYKCVFMVAVDDVPVLQNYIHENAGALRQASRVVIIVYGAQWQLQEQEEAWLSFGQAVHHYLPAASVVSVVDCLEVGGATPLLEQWRRPLLDSSDEVSLPDLGYTLFPLSNESFLIRIKDLLVRPLSGGWFLVRGEATASSQVLEELCAGVARLGTPRPRTTTSPTPPPEHLLVGSVLIEGEDKSASIGPKAALISAVNTFVNTLEKLPTTSAQSTSTPLPRPSFPKEKPQTPQSQVAPFAKPVSTEQVPTPEPELAPQPEIKPVATTTVKPRIHEKTEADIDKAVNTLFTQERTEEKTTHIQKTTQQTKTVVHKLKRRKRVYWGGLVLLGVSLAFMFVGGVFATTYWLVNKELQHSIAVIAESGLTTGSLDLEEKSSTASDALAWQASTMNAVFSLGVFDDAHRLASLAKLTATVPSNLSSWQNGVATWISETLSGETAPSLEQLTALNAQEEQLYADISGISAGLKTAPTGSLSPAEEQALDSFDAELAKTRKQLAAFQQITPLLPQVFGYQQPRTYAIIFQNPQELRATGGFIQSVALVSFNKGLLTDTQVISSYDLDKNLLGVVAPPTDLQRFLGEQRWFLRDANWSADFPTSASHISWFVEQTARRPVDGVIAIDAYTWQAIIKALGPIEVPEYNEVITDKNLLERLEFHSELIFEQGQPKTEYSTLIFTKILNRLKTATPQQIEAVITGLGEKAENANVLVWLKQSSEASVMANLGLDGTILSPSCPDQLLADNCVVETVAQVESNVGVNKANAHLDKATVHTIALQPSQVLHTRVTTYKNNATSTAWPKGPYKAYVRWYLSPTATNPEVFIGQAKVPADQVFFGEEKGKKIVGALLEVPVQGTQQLSLKYVTPLPHLIAQGKQCLTVRSSSN